MPFGTNLLSSEVLRCFHPNLPGFLVDLATKQPCTVEGREKPRTLVPATREPELTVRLQDPDDFPMDVRPLHQPGDNNFPMEVTKYN